MKSPRQKKGLAEPVVTDRILPRLMEALDDLEHVGISHRRICPENLFYLEEAGKNVVLGECFTEPPGYSQSLVFEPLERSMAMPLGRGEGSISTDLYALGVTLACLLLGKNPVASLGADQLWEQKMSRGSFVTLIGDTPLSAPTERLLRGLLNDELAERWSLEDAQGWVWGSSRRPNHRAMGVRALRPIVIGGKEVIYDRLAAHEVGRQMAPAGPEANTKIISLGLQTWAGGGLQDLERGRALNLLFKNLGLAGDEERNLLATRVCAILDQGGPIRFHGLVFMRDGIGALMASAVMNQNTALQASVETFLETDYLRQESTWQTEEQKAENKSFDFNRCREFIRNSAPGFGLERCLYELNPETPCLSPLVVDRGALDLGEVLAAIDAAVGNLGGNANIMDRHIAAFVAARSTVAAKVVPELAQPGGDPAERRLRLLELFAELQSVGRAGPLKNIAAWFQKSMPQIIGLSSSRTRRATMPAMVEMHAQTGDLGAMFKVVGARRVREQDRLERAQAAIEYAELSQLHEDFEEGGPVLRADAKILAYRVVTGLGVGALAFSIWFTAMIGL